MQSQSNIRNFCIISHIDHGKSTLADRFLELTGTVERRKMREQYLDMMDLERERGITIKLQPVRMTYTLHPTPYILNLIDTPGHVDFAYEVSRSLAAVEGAILLVDASQGIQAQTLANLHLAQEQNLAIIPAVNKIDMPIARTEESAKELAGLLAVDESEVLKISAKNGTNVDRILEAIVRKIPPPKIVPLMPLRALIFDSKFDPFLGIIAYVRIVDGEVRKEDEILLMVSSVGSKVSEVGVFNPEFIPCEKLQSGEIGYIATGIKEPGKVRVGDTITKLKITPKKFSQNLTGQENEKLKIVDIEPLAGYKEPKPMVFASFYPSQESDFDLLKDALSKLKLNDASLYFEQDRSEALGRGFKCGFLGMLHMEIIAERLKREFGLSLVITNPSVIYRIMTGKNSPSLLEIHSPAQLPPPAEIQEIREPWAKLEIITPPQYIGAITRLLSSFRAEYKNTVTISPQRIIIEAEAPLAEILVDFYDKLKSVTSGYASMNYEVLNWRPGDLVKLEILIAGEKAEAFAQIVPRNKAYHIAESLLSKLKEVVPPQLFSVALQAQVDGRIIAREDIRALRKDVTGYLYGGDYTRKRKLLEKQKKGKKELKARGRVNLPAEVFLRVLKK